MSGIGLRGYFERRFNPLGRMMLAHMIARAAAMNDPRTMLTSNVEDPKTWRPRPKIGPSCYMPHQGAKECARRRRQVVEAVDYVQMAPVGPLFPPAQRGGKRRSP